MAAALLFAGLSALYILGYLLNKRTEIPEECRDIRIESSKCAACSNSTCGSNPKKG